MYKTMGMPYFTVLSESVSGETEVNKNSVLQTLIIAQLVKKLSAFMEPQGS
jgi:hypothetical protein